MAGYNSIRYSEDPEAPHRWAYLGGYIQKLIKLKREEVDFFFWYSAGILRSVLPYFSIKSRSKYQKMIEVGLVQAQCVFDKKSGKIPTKPDKDEIKRVKSIDNFLKWVKNSKDLQSRLETRLDYLEEIADIDTLNL